MDPIKIYFAVASRVWYILLNILFISMYYYYYNIILSSKRAEYIINIINTYIIIN